MPSAESPPPPDPSKRRKDLGVVERLAGALLNRCPMCLEGHVFSGLLRMRDACEVCGASHEREPGYFTGSMAASYAIGALLAFPIFFILLALDQPLWVVLGAPSLLLLLLSPFLVRYSRLAWMHLDSAFD